MTEKKIPSLKEKLKPLVLNELEEIQSRLWKIMSDEARSSEIGSFLQHHLILESYIEQRLLQLAPVLKQIKIAGEWGFDQKLRALSDVQELPKLRHPTIKAIQSLRNDIAHNIEKAGWSVGQLTHVRSYLTLWRLKPEALDVLLSDKTSHVRLATIVIYFLVLDLMLMINLDKSHKEIGELLEANRIDLADEILRTFKEHFGQE